VYVLAVFRKSRNRGFGLTSTPRELGGSNERRSHSEQLFAAAYTSSFLGMPRLVAARAGIALPPDAVIRHSSRTPDLFTAADALVDKAHGLCPNATQ
jgi:organic hydroperoxide reductase OsmC/OhrA